MLAIVAAHVLFPLIFAFIDGARVYRVRGILIFMLICLAIGNLFENLSILTGFPFGRYHFTNVMGPKLLNVPVLLGLAYIGMGTFRGPWEASFSGRVMPPAPAHRSSARRGVPDGRVGPLDGPDLVEPCARLDLA